MAVLATDTFDRANADPIGGNWTTAGTYAALKIASNVAVPSNQGADGAAYYNAISWPNDQYSQLKVTGGTGGSGVGFGALTRQATGATNTNYRCVVDRGATNNVEMGKTVAGTFTSLKSFSNTWVDSDVLRLESQGTSHRIYRNGTQISTTATDSAIASGNAGMFYSSDEASTGNDWEGGDFTSVSAMKRINDHLRPRAFAPGIGR